MSVGGMSVCPECGHENIPGGDFCEQCGQSITRLSHPSPSNDLERQIVDDRVATLEPNHAYTVSPERTVGDVLKQMVQRKIGCALVVDDGQVTGVFTERDALMKLNADAAQLMGRPVSEFMTPSPESLRSRDRIAFALHKMDLGGYRHVPILDEDEPPKMISIRDILDYMTQRLATT